jgi:uncharacterized membrane protein
MPDIGYFHPQLVHFAVVLGVLGVILRIVSLTGKLAWTGPAARAILIAAGLVGYLTAESGHQAHGPVERIPGAAAAVQEHEEWGDRARNALLVVAALELIGLAVGRRKPAGAIRLAAALAGAAAVWVLYEAGEHGGELVYQYAGGPGIRSGDTTDLTRLLVAGLYHRAVADRAAGEREGAARLIDELIRRMPADPGARLLGIESTLKDRGDAVAAIAALHAFEPGDDRRAKFRKTTLLAEAFKASGKVDSARAVLEAFKAANPASAARIDDLIANLSR